MVLLQAPHMGHHVGLCVRQQWRKQVQFLILVMQGGCHIEVAQYIPGGAVGCITGAMLVKVRHQPTQQVQAALHAFMAGVQHSVRVFETDSGGVESGNGGG